MDDKCRKAVLERLEKIRARNNGVLTPDDVVADAKSTTSPLHGYFTWDDTEAARQYRLDEARSLIRSVKVDVVTTKESVAAPFYIRDPRVESHEQGYGSIAEIRDETDVAADALDYEFNRAIGILERTVSIAESLGMSKQIDALISQARVVQEAIAGVAAAKSPMKKKQGKSAKAHAVPAA